MKTGQVSRAATVMGVATAVSRLLGFGRIVVIAVVLGTTDLGNTFSASNSVSNVLFDLLAAGALSAVLVPGFVELLDGSGDARPAEQLGGALLGWALAVLAPVCVVGVAAAPAIARLLVAGTPDPAVADRQAELATFLLRLFIPQVLLYAYGAVATAVLHAQRRFTVTAIAPIGNTLVVVAALAAFRIMVGGGEPGFDLTLAEQLTLGAAGTLGVVAFVGIPAVALWRNGFRLLPRWERPRPGRNSGSSRAIPGLGRAVRLSGWAGLQHAGTGILLGAALLVGMGVSGGVVAYQVAFACFLVPYAVLALPVITAVLPELTQEAQAAAGAGDLTAFGRSVRWSLGRMIGVVVPVTVAGAVFAPRVMEAVAVGETSGAGGRLIGAALATLALGLLPYSAFLLFVRAYYALGIGRRPAQVALATALGGAALMGVAGSMVDGDARLAVMGLAHTAAYLAGAVVLGRDLARRTGVALVPAGLGRAVTVAVGVGAGAAVALAAIDPAGRVATLVVTGGLGAAGALLYKLVGRHAGRPPIAAMETTRT